MLSMDVRGLCASCSLLVAQYNRNECTATLPTLYQAHVWLAQADPAGCPLQLVRHVQCRRLQVRWSRYRLQPVRHVQCRRWQARWSRYRLQPVHHVQCRRLQAPWSRYRLQPVRHVQCRQLQAHRSRCLLLHRRNFRRHYHHPGRHLGQRRQTLLLTTWLSKQLLIWSSL